MKLTWFAATTMRIHIGGRILVADPELAPPFIAQRGLLSGADQTFALATDDPGLPTADPVKWRPRAIPKFIDDTPADECVGIFRLGPGAILIDALGEPPFVLLADAAPPRFGRWANDAVIVLFGAGEGLVATGSVLLDIAQPKLLALAADEATLDLAIDELREHLDGTALVSLEPGLALEV